MMNYNIYKVSVRNLSASNSLWKKNSIFFMNMILMYDVGSPKHCRCESLPLLRHCTDPVSRKYQIFKKSPPPPFKIYIYFFGGGVVIFVNFKLITRSIHSSLFSMHYKTGQVWSGIKTIPRPKEFYCAPWSEILGSTTIQVTSNTETIQFQVISMTCKPKLDYYPDQLGLPTM